ncbi:MAG: hypothetical protein L6Q97_09930 [Thermoanaerobaculia bacterium]|nr:hypothetical protein [Thermoanaerobaculia bacterium]
MKTNQIIYYAIFLLAGGIGGYWLGSRSAKTITETPAAIAVSNPEKAPVEPAALPAETPAAPETAAEPAEAKPAETPETAAAPANAPAPPAAKPASTPAVTATTPANPSASPASSASAGSLPTASKCFSGDKELEDDLNLYASEIEAKKLIYSRELMQDCSGIFYRLLDEFAKKKCDGYQYPDPKSARPARMIAKWFFDNKNFKLVKDPMVSRNMIKPGAVMFYGAPGKKYHDTGIEQLSQQGGIFHVGVDLLPQYPRPVQPRSAGAGRRFAGVGRDQLSVYAQDLSFRKFTLYLTRQSGIQLEPRRQPHPHGKSKAASAAFEQIAFIRKVVVVERLVAAR